MHTPGAQVSNVCTQQLKCAHRVQGAPLISNTEPGTCILRTHYWCPISCIYVASSVIISVYWIIVQTLR